MRRALPLILLALSGSLAAGCGGGDESAVRDDLKAYAEAARDKNGKEACSRIVGFDKVIPAQLAGNGGAQRLCEQSIGQQGLANSDRVLGQLEDAEVKVTGETATASVGGESIPMRKDGDVWKLDAAAVAKRAGQQGGAQQGGAAGGSGGGASTATAPTAATPPTSTGG